MFHREDLSQMFTHMDYSPRVTGALLFGDNWVLLFNVFPG